MAYWREVSKCDRFAILARQEGKREKFVCKCGKLKIWTDPSYLIYLEISGEFRLEGAGKLGLVGPVCNSCGKSPKGDDDIRE